MSRFAIFVCLLSGFAPQLASAAEHADCLALDELKLRDLSAVYELELVAELA